MGLRELAGLFGFVSGLCLGSFGLVLALRSLKNQTFRGRSQCPHCNYTLRLGDLLPLVSYLVLGGRCRKCKKPIGVQYPLTELATGFLVGFLFWQSYTSLQSSAISLQTFYSFQFLFFIADLLFKAFFVTILVVLFITDYKKMLIPDRIIIPSIKAAFIYLTFATAGKLGYLYYALNRSPIGKLLLPPHTDYFQRHTLITSFPLLGGIVMAVVLGGFFYSLIIITKGKGMGGGDVKLGIFMGIVLGFPNALLALILSFLSGAVFSIILIFTKRKHFGQTIPFGPFLVIGSLVALFFGQQIINWYLNFSI